jgi:hypothetical protein
MVDLAGLSDERLAVRAGAGDPRAFERLFERHHAAILGFCRHVLGSREEGEDALQQTFLRAVEALRRSVSAEINTIRQECFETLKTNLAALIDNRLDPLPFAESFFALSEMSHVRADVYQRMILSLLMSSKVRPAAKMLVLQRFDRVPRALQLNIIKTIAYAERNAANDYVKEELYWMVQRNPDLLRGAQ